jgi:hypothetical protein
MDMRRVVPACRERSRVAVENDAAPHEDEPVDVLLDGSELVRAEEDRHTEVVMELLEECGQRLLSVDVDARRRLVEDEQVRSCDKGFRQERALLLPARETAQDRPGLARKADALDGLGDDRAFTATDQAARDTATLDDLTDRGGRVDAELSPLGEVSDLPSASELACWLAEEQCLAPRRVLEPDGNAQEGRLAAAVRAGDGHELASFDLEIDVVEDLGPTRVGEAHVTEIDR